MRALHVALALHECPALVTKRTQQLTDCIARTNDRWSELKSLSERVTDRIAALEECDQRKSWGERLNCETPLFRLNDEQLAQCPLSADELFCYTPENADGLPIGGIQQFSPFACLSAQSVFVTAKAANMTLLMSLFLIHALHGQSFTVPANHMMYFAPTDPADISKQLTDLASFSCLPVLRATRQSPDAVLSRDIF